MDYLNPDLIVNSKETEYLPNKGNTRTGYGCQIPTHHMLQLKTKRWHRVYVVCYSNSGTAYIVVKGKPQYLMSTFDPKDYRRE